MTKKRWIVWLSFLLLGVGLILVGCTGRNQGNVASNEQIQRLESDLAALRESHVSLQSELDRMEQNLTAEQARLMRLEERQPSLGTESVTTDITSDDGLHKLDERVDTLATNLAQLQADFDKLASTFAEMQQRVPDRQPPSGWESGNQP